MTLCKTIHGILIYVLSFIYTLLFIIYQYQNVKLLLFGVSIAHNIMTVSMIFEKCVYVITMFLRIYIYICIACYPKYLSKIAKFLANSVCNYKFTKDRYY